MVYLHVIAYPITVPGTILKMNELQIHFLSLLHAGKMHNLSWVSKKATGQFNVSDVGKKYSVSSQW